MSIRDGIRGAAQTTGYLVWMVVFLTACALWLPDQSLQEALTWIRSLKP